MLKAVGMPMLALLMLVAGCSPPRAPASAETGAGQPASPKRVTAAIFNDIANLVSRMNPASGPGQGPMEQLVLSGLNELTGEGILQPVLAEAVPSLENGLWELQTDGHMTTTWRIREGARWHDGSPLTSEDLVFTTTVDRDRELPIRRDPGYQNFESIEAVDAQTVVVHWSKPYINANAIFGAGRSANGFATPLPKHLLEDTYLQNKNAFLSGPYWNEQFVGTGPFKVRAYTPGSGLSLAANDGYLLGRPKIDELEIKFILDLDAISAGLLTGDIDLTLTRGFTVDRALDMRQRWQDGEVRMYPSSWLVIYPQFIDASPAIVGDARFRKALMYATDRQQLVDVLEHGLSPIAHVFLNPNEPEYKELEPRVVHYDYDPRRAAQMIGELGYVKDAAGFYRDAKGDELDVEMRSDPVAQLAPQATLSVADQWTRFGIRTEPVPIPTERWLHDPEYRATFPGFYTSRYPDTANDLQNYRAALTPTAENHYQGGNQPRYQNPEFNRLLDLYYATIPTAERMEVLAQVVYHISDQLNLMGLFYDASVTMVNGRLRNITTTDKASWNIYQWDVG